MKFIISFLVLVFVASSVIAAPPIVPLTPANFDAIAHPGKKVALTWDKDPDAIGYNVYRRTNDSGFKKIAALLRSNSFEDQNVSAGKSYEYYVTSAGILNAESKRSNIASAPNMFIDPYARVAHLGGDMVRMKSARTGKPISVAVPGDIVTYIIRIGNNGYGKAVNALVTFPVPAGTKLIPNSMNSGKFKANYTYFDKRQGRWVAKISEAANISKVRFQILDQIDPLAGGYNGQLSFKVLIET